LAGSGHWRGGEPVCAVFTLETGSNRAVRVHTGPDPLLRRSSNPPPSEIIRTENPLWKRSRPTRNDGAGSGAEAVESYRKHRGRIDLVILDMIMPGMNGGQTYDRLKQIDPEVKVLLSSGYSINGEASDILARGCSGFIQKPFNLIEMSRKVRKVLDC
jgi:CheY-like chemotaxis protein